MTMAKKNLFTPEVVVQWLKRGRVRAEALTVEKYPDDDLSMFWKKDYEDYEDYEEEATYSYQISALRVWLSGEEEDFVDLHYTKEVSIYRRGFRILSPKAGIVGKIFFTYDKIQGKWKTLTRVKAVKDYALKVREELYWMANLRKDHKYLCSTLKGEVRDIQSKLGLEVSSYIDPVNGKVVVELEGVLPPSSFESLIYHLNRLDFLPKEEVSSKTHWERLKGVETSECSGRTPEEP